MADPGSRAPHGAAAAAAGGGGGGARAGAANFQRRTWDRDEFERRGKERLEKDLTGESLEAAAAGPAAAFRAAPPGLKGPEGSERAYVTSREFDLHLDAKLGKRRLVTETTPQHQVGGYFCETCACTLRDSTSYLDHINGRNHQKRLGFSMRVERSSAEQVKARFEQLKAKSAAAAGPTGARGRAALDAEDRYALAAMDSPAIHMVSAAMATVPTARGAALYGGAPAGAAAAAPGAPLADGASAAPGDPLPKRPRPEPPAAAAELPLAAGGSSTAANDANDGSGSDDELASMMGFSAFGGAKKR